MAVVNERRNIVECTVCGMSINLAGITVRTSRPLIAEFTRYHKGHKGKTRRVSRRSRRSDPDPNQLSLDLDA